MFHQGPRRVATDAAVFSAVLVLAACRQPADDLATEVTTTSTTVTGDDSSAPPTSAATGPPSSAATEAEATTIAVALAGGNVVGKVRTEVVPLDEAVRLEVSGDTAEEVHVHTYDLYGDVAPAEPAVIEFVADIPGVHEVELEGSHRVILQLQVEP